MAFVKYLIGLWTLFAPGIALASIPLLQPLGQENSVPAVTPGTLPIFVYFNYSIQYLYRVGVGICVVWIVISGIQIIIAGDDSKAGAAKERMKQVIIAILILTFAGFILRSLNDLFYV